MNLTHSQIAFDLAGPIVDAQQLAGRARFAELGANLCIGIGTVKLTLGVQRGTADQSQARKQHDANGPAVSRIERGQLWQHVSQGR